MRAQLLILLTFATLHAVALSQKVTILESVFGTVSCSIKYYVCFLIHLLLLFRLAQRQTVFLVFQEVRAYQALTVVTG